MLWFNIDFYCLVMTYIFTLFWGVVTVMYGNK